MGQAFQALNSSVWLTRAKLLLHKLNGFAPLRAAENPQNVVARHQVIGWNGHAWGVGLNLYALTAENVALHSVDANFDYFCPSYWQ